MMDTRIEKIKQNMLEAVTLRDDAMKLFEAAEKKLAQSEVEAADIVAHAHKEAELIIENTRVKLEKDIEIRKKLALQKIQSFEENAINELKKNISNITVAAAAQVIEENNGDENFKKSVSSSLEKLSKTIH